MPRFSQQSFSALSTCHPDLQTVFYEVIKHVDCIVIEGFRNQTDQDLAYERGNTQLKWPKGRHNHSPSLAVDVAPYPVDWHNISRFYWFAGFVMGVSEILFMSGKITHKVRFGGDWNRDYRIENNHFNDLVHFEIIEV